MRHGGRPRACRAAYRAQRSPVITSGRAGGCIHQYRARHPLQRPSCFTMAGKPARSAAWWWRNNPPYDRQPCPRRHPLPSSGLPAQIDLKSALRLDLALGAAQTGWIRPENFGASAAPAFRAKAGHPFGLADCLCSERASPLSSRRRIRRRGAETRPVALPASLRQSNRGRPRGQPRRASRPR